MTINTTTTETRVVKAEVGYDAIRSLILAANPVLKDLEGGQCTPFTNKLVFTFTQKDENTEQFALEAVREPVMGPLEFPMEPRQRPAVFRYTPEQYDRVYNYLERGRASFKGTYLSTKPFTDEQKKQIVRECLQAWNRDGEPDGTFITTWYTSNVFDNATDRLRPEFVPGQNLMAEPAFPGSWEPTAEQKAAAADYLDERFYSFTRKLNKGSNEEVVAEALAAWHEAGEPELKPYLKDWYVENKYVETSAAYIKD